MAQSIRTTTYHIAAAQWAAAALTYTLVLDDDLAENYFILIGGCDSTTVNTTPTESAVRVSSDPHGTGDLGTSAAADEVVLTRGAATNAWQGSVTVVECLGDPSASGFQLVDVSVVTLADFAFAGVQYTDVTPNALWSDLEQVVVYWGLRGTNTSTDAVTGGADWASVCGQCWPQPDETLRVARASIGAGYVEEATATLYVVEWGSEWTIQRQKVPGWMANDWTDTRTWDQTGLETAVAREHTWVWASGWSYDEGAGDGPLGLVAALGDGVTEDTVEQVVSSTGRYNDSRSVLVCVHTHADLVVDHVDAENEPAAAVVAIGVDAPTGAEAYVAGPPVYTTGYRVGLLHGYPETNAANVAGESLWSIRHTAAAVLTLTRVASTVICDLKVQSIDFAGLTYSDETVTGEDKSADTYVGLVLPDRRLEVWDDESSYTQADPRPGVPEASQGTGMVLRTSGTATADRHLHVMSMRGGYPGSQGAADGASYVWREDGDGDTEWRGWDPPHVQTGWECLEWTDAAGAGVVKWTKDPHAVTLADGSVLVAYSIYDDGEPTYKYQVQVRRKPAGSQTWTAAVGVVTWSAAPTLEMRPCLLVLPSGRVLLYHLLDRSGNTQVRMWYSDDDGASWALGQDYCLNLEVGWDWGRYRLATMDGQILLVAHVDVVGGTRDSLWQFASSDLGCTFDSIGLVDEANYLLGFPDIAVSGGCFVVTYVWYDTLTPAAGVEAIRLGSAYEDMEAIRDGGDAVSVWDAAAAGDVWAVMLAGPVHFDVGYGLHALCVDETDTLYCYGAQVADGRGYLVRSIDGGITWEDMGTGSNPDAMATATGMWWYAATATTYPFDFAVTAAEGRVVMIHNWESATSAESPYSLAVSYFGGYSSVTMPGYEGFPSELTRVGWESVWYPCDLPDNLNWVLTTAGGPLVALAAPGVLSITTAGGADRHFYAIVPTFATPPEPVIVRCDLEMAAGGNLAAGDVSVYIRIDDGVEGYAVEVRFILDVDANLHNEVWDATAAARIGAADIDVGAAIGSLIIALDIAECTVWHRARDLDADRLWEVGITAEAVADNGGAAGTCHILWGHRNVCVAESEWHEVHQVNYTYAGTGLGAGQTNPDELLARGYSFTGTYLDGGTILQAVDGPTIRSDAWEVQTRYGYEMARVFKASPRIAWRSTSTAQQSLAFSISDVGDADLGNDIIGIGLYGTNVPEVNVYLYDTVWGWVYFGNPMSYERMRGLGYDRHGNTVRPSTDGSTYNPSFALDELKGGYFWFDASDSRRISENCEGVWNSGGTKEAVLYLEDCDDTEADSGTDGRICPRNWLFLVHLYGQRYSGIKLVIPPAGAVVPAPPEDYWEIGSLVIGPVAVFGQHHAWGRVIEPHAGAEVFEARDGTSQSYVASPVQRIVEVDWQDGCDISQVQDPDGEADPDFVYADDNPGSLPVAWRRDISPLLHGILRRIDGPHRPVVYVPRLVKDDGKTPIQVLPRRWQHVHMRLTGTLRIAASQGDPNDTEVTRVSLSGKEVV